MSKPAPAWQLNPLEIERFGRDHGIAKRLGVLPRRMHASAGGYIRESDVAHVVTVRRGLSVRWANRMVRHEFEHVLHGLELWEQRRLADEGVELTSWQVFDRFVAEEHQAMKKKHGVTGDLLREHPDLYDDLGSEVRANQAMRQRHGYRFVTRVPLRKRVRRTARRRRNTPRRPSKSG
jgi:hypothetical protein